MENEVEKDFLVPQSLGAMAKTFYVKVAKSLSNTDTWYLKQGSMVTGVKVIAEGTAVITNGVDTYVNCEIHWYQCENIGKLNLK